MTMIQSKTKGPNPTPTPIHNVLSPSSEEGVRDANELPNVYFVRREIVGRDAKESQYDHV